MTNAALLVDARCLTRIQTLQIRDCRRLRPVDWSIPYLRTSCEDYGFASRVLQHGCAACVGFADVALPFRTVAPFLLGLCPLLVSRVLGTCA
jgi:hypothetical protein